jgi:hypothetical protein
VIFDLGYFDYGLLYSIQRVGGFYLCRLKSNASLCIKEVVQGLSKKHVGKSLLSIKFKWAIHITQVLTTYCGHHPHNRVQSSVPYGIYSFVNHTVAISIS